MFSGRAILTMTLAAILLAAASCGPKKTGTKRTRIGRDGRSSVSTSTGVPNSPSNGSSAWAAIGNNQGDNVFQQELFYLTQPTLGGASQDDQLGYVSSNVNDNNTGVRFWGYVPFTMNGQIDGANSELNIEIYDSKFQTRRADGSLVNQVRIYIGKQYAECFGNVTGYVQGNVAQVQFNDCVGSIVFSGQLSGNTFNGQVFYSTPQTGGLRTLGQFQVNKCQFFRCQ